MSSGGIEQRVYMHWKSLKHASRRRFVVDKHCGPYAPCPSMDHPLVSHMHGHYETTTDNVIWLRLARVHKMPVRKVKDIINKKRGK